MAYEWLSWLDAFYYGYEVLFAGKCEEGEKRVLINRKYKVDGYHKATKTIFEFAGCAVHGCDKCTLPDKRSVFDNETNRDRKTQFDNRLARFAQCGYKVEVMWECEWKDLKERDESVRLQLEEIADETYKREPIIPEMLFMVVGQKFFLCFSTLPCKWMVGKVRWLISIPCILIS